MDQILYLEIFLQLAVEKVAHTTQFPVVLVVLVAAGAGLLVVTQVSLGLVCLVKEIVAALVALPMEQVGQVAAALVQ
jgi:hypothetical protein